MAESAVAESVGAEAADAGRNDVVALLRSLVPELAPEVVLVDVHGREHRRRGVASARTQIHVAALLERVDLDSARAAFSGDDRSPIGLVRALVRWVTEHPELLDLLDEVAERLFPCLAAEADGAAAVTDGARATDLFALEDLLTAILPFVVRPLLRFLDAAEGRTVTSQPSR